jgi:type II secretory pathway pseudopilin PulG
MIRRVGRPGLVGTMARTAVIAGTATAVSGGMQARQQQRGQEQAAAQQQEQLAAAQQAQQLAAQQAQPPAPAQDDMMAQLGKLGQMNQAGLLTDAEFAAAKAKLLGI